VRPRCAGGVGISIAFGPIRAVGARGRAGSAWCGRLVLKRAIGAVPSMEESALGKQ